MKILIVIFMVILILCIPSIVTAQASPEGQIDGQVTFEPNVEADIADLEVTLSWFSGTELETSYGTRTNDDGAFRFANLSTDPDYTYFVSVHYEGSEFHSSAITFESGENLRSIEITVFPFDSSDDDNLKYLFAAFAIVWVAIFGYILFLQQRQKRLKHDIEMLKMLIKKKD